MSTLPDYRDVRLPMHASGLPLICTMHLTHTRLYSDIEQGFGFCILVMASTVTLYGRTTSRKITLNRP